MKTYLISYDLGSPENINDYIKISEAIRSHLNWAKVLQSVWIVKTNRSRQEIFNVIKNTIDSNDKILIIEVTSDWIAYGLSAEVVKWLREQVV